MKLIEGSNWLDNLRKHLPHFLFPTVWTPITQRLFGFISNCFLITGIMSPLATIFALSPSDTIDTFTAHTNMTYVIFCDLNIAFITKELIVSWVVKVIFIFQFLLTHFAFQTRLTDKIFSIFYMFFIFVPTYYLYKKKIYIKV